MTASAQEHQGPDTIQPIAELFMGTVTALWATTFSIDLALFNEFLLPRLGDPPLNVTVLADHQRLAAGLERIPAERADTLAAVNSRWLLRGVRLGGAFHAKSYMAVTRAGASLLVGSGNLSAGGLDEGKEVFTAFRSGTVTGDAAITAWRLWMRRLIGYTADSVLAERFRDLEGRIALPQARSAEAAPSLLHNLDVPIADQLVEAVSASGDAVEELWLSAPFYDADAVAAGVLLDRLAPSRVRLFVTEVTSVNGGRLAARLKSNGAKVTVAGYDPDQFVHAKLVGVIAGRRAWILSGSANISQAGLTLTPASHGNVELAVVAGLDPDDMRTAFLPPGASLRQLTLSSLASLSHRADPESPLPGVRLLAATALDDGRIEIRADPVEGEWLLDDLTTHQPLVLSRHDHMLTAGPLPGRLVQLTDPAGNLLSNRIVVDDPVTLAFTLAGGATRSDAGRPPELGPGDFDSPLARALIYLNRNLVMDVSEQDRAAGTGGIGASEAADQAEDDLWDRLERERLARDPRASTYERLWRRQDADGSEPVIELIEALRDRAPAGGQSHVGSLLARLLNQDDAEDDQPVVPVRRWAASTRLRVRVRNVFRRWAAAQTDTRLLWVNPLAPAVNFAVVTAVLAQLRLDQARRPDQIELTSDDLDDIWQRWLRAFAGTGQRDGWFDRIDDATRALARDRLPDWLSEAVGALCWLVIQPGTNQRHRIIQFQPVLTATLSCRLLDPTEMSARYLSVITDRSVTRRQVEDQLLDAIEYIDDDLWCTRTADDLGLDALSLEAPPGAASIQVRLDVGGIDDPLLDPRVPRLVAAVRHYRRCDGVAVFAPSADWRLTLVTGETVAYRPGPGADFGESAATLTADSVEQLAATGGVLADLFLSAHDAAA